MCARIYNIKQTFYLKFLKNYFILRCQRCGTYTITENELLQQVAQGDEKDFGRLMEQNANLLGSHIFRLTHGRRNCTGCISLSFAGAGSAYNPLWKTGAGYVFNPDNCWVPLKSMKYAPLLQGHL